MLSSHSVSCCMFLEMNLIELRDMMKEIIFPVARLMITKLKLVSTTGHYRHIITCPFITDMQTVGCVEGGL